jgi:hydrogenase maturation protein HypF
MTSGNRSGEPLCYRDEDALERLSNVADFVLTHDRPIHARCDDSVVQIASQSTYVVRRSRGIVPRPIRMPEPASSPILAVGGHQKNAFCLAVGHDAYLSPHIGDLDELETYQALKSGIGEYQRLFSIEPAVVVHDRHPDYGSTRIAQEIDVEHTISVQHHHAHVLSCVVEHGIDGPVIGVAFDGAGLGDDGAVWGGEFLRVEGVTCERLAHLSYVALPGGDRAAREPWRMALSHALAAGVSPSNPVLESIRRRVVTRTFDAVGRHAVQSARVAQTSSMGRLFDAIASLVGLRDTAAFEGQPAMELEAIAGEEGGVRYDFDIDRSSRPWRIDPAPLVQSAITDTGRQKTAAHIATAFHESVASMVRDVSLKLARETGIRTVVLTGGVFQNARLTDSSLRGLSAAGLEVFTHQRVPCNDGGLALGQALYAARLMRAARW